jgi:putative DeoR family transcriptional regulator (stage III sporulation protein D)
LKGYIEERAVEIANYIIDNNATVRQTAKQFGISKSTVHIVVTKTNGHVKFVGMQNSL